MGTLFSEQIAIKASNRSTREIDIIELQKKLTWLPPKLFSILLFKLDFFMKDTELKMKFV